MFKKFDNYKIRHLSSQGEKIHGYCHSTALEGIQNLEKKKEREMLHRAMSHKMVHFKGVGWRWHCKYRHGCPGLKTSSYEKKAV